MALNLSEVLLLTQSAGLLLGLATLLGNQRVSPSLDVCEQNIGQLVQVRDAQVGKGLCGRVNGLVDQVSLDLVRVGLFPVDVLLSLGNETSQFQWNLVVTKTVGQRTNLGVVLGDAVDHFSDFQEQQLLWTVQLVGLTGSGVIVTDFFQSLGHIKNMYGVNLLGVSVGRPHLQLGSQVVQ